MVNKTATVDHWVGFHFSSEKVAFHFSTSEKVAFHFSTSDGSVDLEFRRHTLRKKPRSSPWSSP